MSRTAARKDINSKEKGPELLLLIARMPEQYISRHRKRVGRAPGVGG
jgi:hypothetical protein